jgi:hypothetical protein
MRTRRPVLALALALVASTAITACSSSTMIHSNVPGAKVYLDGEFVGRTPYLMSDTKIVGSTTAVRIEAPGYEPVNGAIRRNEEFSVGACIGGVLVLVPFLWIMEYKPTHQFELRPAAVGPGQDQGPGGWSAPPPGSY